MLENFPNYDIWLTGDFNTRTADKDSIEDIRDKNEGFKDILRNRGKRKSKDKVINLEGEKLIDFCIKENFYIMNGNYPQDLEGDFTYISKLGTSTIDYILVTEELRERVNIFKINDICFSNHNILSLEIKIQNVFIQKKSKKDKYQVTTKSNMVIWCEEKRENLKVRRKKKLFNKIKPKIRKRD